MEEQVYDDLLEFLHMLDFKKINDNEIEIVSNRFTIDELPATIQDYIKDYLRYMETVE